MGNSASVPEDCDGPVAPPPKVMVKPPQDWNDEDNFIMISPQSDLSNPSQFRHRLKDPRAIPLTATNPPVTRARHGAHAPRQTQRRSDAVPPPTSFYFEGHGPHENQENMPNKSNNKVTTDVAGRKWIVDKRRAMKKRAKQAKKAFQGCWEDKRDTFEGCVRDKQPEHERLQSLLSPRLNREPDAMVDPAVRGAVLKEDAPQLVLPKDKTDDDVFNPALEASVEFQELKQKIGTLRPYIHDEEVYVDRIVDQNQRDSSPTQITPMAKPRNQKKELLARADEKVHYTLDQVESERSPYSEEKKQDTYESHTDAELKMENKPQVEERLVLSAVVVSKETSQPLQEKENAVKQINESFKKAVGGRSSSYPPQLRKEARMYAQKQASRGSGETSKSLPTVSRGKSSQEEAAIKKLEHAKKMMERNNSYHASKSRNEKLVASKKSVAPMVEEQQGNTMSRMLLQTYPIAYACGDTESNAALAISKAENHKLERVSQALTTATPRVAPTTPMTPVSDSSKGNVSKEAIQNATFLFSPSYAEGDNSLLKLPAPHKGATPFSISTEGSRNRLVPQPRSDPGQYRPGENEDSSSASTASTRRVRFSGSSNGSNPSHGNEATNSEKGDFGEIHVPPIPRNLSDLTDTSHTRESSVSNASSFGMHVKYAAVSPIPEETLLNESSSDEEESYNPSSILPPPEEHIEDEIHDEDELLNTTANTTILEYPTNWSVAMDNGVTPLRSGKSTTNATHSPFIRFKEAKRKFSNESEKKVQAVKRSSPVHKRSKGGLVYSRVVAMEEIASQNSRRDTGLSHSSSGSYQSSISSKFSQTSYDADASKSRGSSISTAGEKSPRSSVGNRVRALTSMASHSRYSGDTRSTFESTTRHSSVAPTVSRATGSIASREESLVSQTSRSIAPRDPSVASRGSVESRTAVSIVSQATESITSHGASVVSKGKFSVNSLVSKQSIASEAPSLGERVRQLAIKNERLSAEPSTRLSNSSRATRTRVEPTGEHQNGKLSIESVNSGGGSRPFAIEYQQKNSSSSHTSMSSKRGSNGSMSEKHSTLPSDEEKRVSLSSSRASTGASTHLSNDPFASVLNEEETEEMETEVENDYDEEIPKEDALEDVGQEDDEDAHEDDQSLGGQFRRSISSRFGEEPSSTGTANVDESDIVDDFAALLIDEESVHEDDESSVGDQATVSTVRHMHEVDRMISDEPYFSVDDNASTSTLSTIRQQREPQVSIMSTGGASSTFSSVLKHDDDESSLLFQDPEMSGAVRPEFMQTSMPMVPMPGCGYSGPGGGIPLPGGGVPVPGGGGIPVPGGLYLSSSTTKTPQKWRQLAAAAAQEKGAYRKPRRSLSETTNLWD